MLADIGSAQKTLCRDVTMRMHAHAQLGVVQVQGRDALNGSGARR